MGEQIRNAVENDASEILKMISELAEYHENFIECESSSCKAEATEEEIKNALFKKKYLQAFVVEDENNKLAGMAIYYINFSTWTGKPGIVLEDLYVRPKYRGKGYGVKLLKRLAKEVENINGARLDWSVLSSNTSSVNFYESDIIGAKRKVGWELMRLEGDNLHKLSRD